VASSYTASGEIPRTGPPASNCSWTYLKDANRAAADVIQQDIDSPRIPVVIKFRTRVANWIRKVRNTILRRKGDKFA
jgi:hypothetical protein